MYAKKSGSAILSSIVFLSIVSIVAIALFKCTQNNMKMQVMNDFELDTYDISQGEEEILKNFMDKINLKIQDSEVLEEGNTIFSENFIINDNDSELRYLKDEDIFILQYKNEEKGTIKRKIKYSIKDNKIIFIPTYTYTK